MARLGIAAAPVGQQFEEQWNGDLPPDDSQEQDIDVLLAEFPVRAVKNEFTGSSIWQQEQHQPGHVRRTQRMLVEETFQTTNHGISLCAAGEPRRESGVADILGLDQGKDHEGEQFDLVLPVVRKMSSEAARQGLKGNERRALFSRVRRKISSPQKIVGY